MGTYTATIGGVSVNVHARSLAVESQVGQRGQGQMRVWGPLGVIWQYGTAVRVYDDLGALVYSGYVQKDLASKPPGQRQGDGFLEHDLTLMDNAYRADKRRVFRTYLLAMAGDIVRDLLARYLAAEGVTATASSIAGGLQITEVIWNGSKSVGEALTWLAAQCGYWWQIDLNGVLWFQPYGGVPAPFPIDGSQVDSFQMVQVESGNDLYINTMYTKGSVSETPTDLVETFQGDGARRAFTLTYPIARLKSLTLNGSDITAQALTKGDTGGYFYYAVGDAVLAEDPSRPTLTSSDTLVATFRGRYPVLAVARNSALIAAQKAREGGGTGIVESIYTSTKVRTLSAAFQIASAMLAHYGVDTTILTFLTRSKGLRPGQMLTATLTDFNLVNKPMLVSDVTLTDQVDGINIWYQVAAVGSPVEVAQWPTFWSNLMQQSSDPSDYTDADDTSLALLSVTTLTGAHSFTVTGGKHVCPIIGNATLIGNTLIIC